MVGVVGGKGGGGGAERCQNGCSGPICGVVVGLGFRVECSLGFGVFKLSHGVCLGFRVSSLKVYR